MVTPVVPVILSGGSGTRLWPLSREKYPKQFLSLLGESSLLQDTVARLAGIEQLAAPLVVCNEDHRFVVAEQMRQLGVAASLLLEPAGRNTAPALTLAALWLRDGVRALDPESVLIVTPADHAIADLPAFQSALGKAITLARKGFAVTFGITPTQPETGYGYVQRGEALAAMPGSFALARFVEKPARQTAEAYVASGHYVWNSGIFVMKVSTWLAALGACRPDILSACQRALQVTRPDGDFVRVDTAAFAACPSESIDYAVMEHLSGQSAALPPGAVVPVSCGWSDVGSWDSLWQAMDHDAQGNASRGDTMMLDCRNSLVLSQGRLVACVGLQGAMVVETDDAVLVVDRHATQRVKEVVAQLKARGGAQVDEPRKVHRPWGWYDSVDHGGRFQVKHIHVKPGGKLSLQMHHHRAEHWIVVRGTARVTRGDEVFLVGENESTYIPLGMKHRLENPGVVPLELIEVQSGSYLGEDDIVRFEDTYGR